jgi:hypothetical protein
VWHARCSVSLGTSITINEKLTGVLRKVFFIIVFFALATGLGAPGQRTRADDNGSPHSADKTEDKNKRTTDTRWSADPKRGWIKKDERQEPRKKAEASRSRSESSNGNSGPILWEY